MDRYKHLYFWMIIPLIVGQVGIFSYYWPKVTSVYWEIHVHYWLVTTWYLLIVLQPYLAVKGNLAKHRTIGIFGILLAGGVIFSGITILDIPLKLVSKLDPLKAGPPAAFYYGTLVVELVLMLAFAYAVAKSIIHRKQLHEHAWWLICSAFYMMPPALGRGMITFWRNVLPADGFSPLFPLVSTELIYLPLLLFFAYKFKQLRHQATIIGILLVLVRTLRFPIGSSETIQGILEAAIKYQ
ncbi:MAG: hypothetical protein HKN33_14545 [Pyrinomonadaceae bacterium]|nr:hypothetical protein [Pyrinomonadaceae bacterium]